MCYNQLIYSCLRCDITCDVGDVFRVSIPSPSGRAKVGGGLPQPGNDAPRCGGNHPCCGNDAPGRNNASLAESENITNITSNVTRNSLIHSVSDISDVFFFYFNDGERRLERESAPTFLADGFPLFVL